MMDKDWSHIVKNLRRGHWDVPLAAAYRKWFRWRGPQGVPVVERDWDYLIVLDACRYDIFREHHTLEGGTLEKHRSRSSTSVEFFNQNFTAYYDDLVYVTENPHASPLRDAHFQRKHFDGNKHFHELVELFLEDDPNETVKQTPEFAVERALEVREKYPGKRMGVHMMSPHTPYIGPSAPEEDWSIRGYRDNGYSWKEIKELYIEDMHRALEAVQTFIDAVEGKIVITADHGEAFGEWGITTHPHSVYIKPLVEVPWYVIEKGERPEIRGEEEITELDI